MNEHTIIDIINALKFYKLEVEAIRSNLESGRFKAIEASLTVLSLDNGYRADKAIKELRKMLNETP